MAWFRRKVHLDDELSAYVDGELGDRARRSVEAHLASCEECSILLEELRGTKQLLSQLPRVEPSRPLVLGPQHAVRQAPAPAPKRVSFALAPAVSLSFLVALLFVDAIDTGGGSQTNDAFGTSGATTASRAVEQSQAESALNAEQTPLDAAAGSTFAGAADDSAGDGGSGGEATSGAGVAGGGAEAGSQPAEEPTPAPDVAAAAPAAESLTQGDADTSAPESPPEAGLLEEADDSSGGLSTLRILQIVAAATLAASLLAVFLPRIVGRQER